MDLKFKEQFEIPHPSDAYSAALAAAPDMYIGRAADVVPIVQVCDLGTGKHWKGGREDWAMHHMAMMLYLQVVVSGSFNAEVRFQPFELF